MASRKARLYLASPGTITYMLDAPTSATFYKIDPSENWLLRPDVAGYQYDSPGKNWRIGIIRDVVETDTQLEAIRLVLETPFDLTSGHELTRNMARAIIPVKSLLAPSPKLAALLQHVEGVLDLRESGSQYFIDCAQVIFATNHESRRTSEAVWKQEVESAEKIYNDALVRFQISTSKPLLPNLSLQTLQADSDFGLLSAYADHVAAAFAEERDAIFKSIAKGLDIHVAAFDGNVVACSGYACRDIDVIRRDGSNHRLLTYEIRGAKTNPDYANQGIFTHLQRALLQASSIIKGVHLVFDYCNAREPAMFSVAAKSGKVLSATTAKGYNMTYRPAMQQAMTDGILVDEIITYTPGNYLRKFYGPNKNATLLG